MARFMNRLAVVRCLMVLCLWQGPVPVWHAHGTLADASDASRMWLAEHLESHHAAVDPCEPVFFGWHLHFDVPDSEGDPQNTPSPSLRFAVVPVGVVDGDRLVSGTEVPAAAFAIHPLIPALTVESADAPRSTRRGFFPDDAAALPLPLRIGVARC
jgi:hypothetical protein